jgi:hypothetical protein
MPPLSGDRGIFKRVPGNLSPDSAALTIPLHLAKGPEHRLLLSSAVVLITVLGAS